MMKLKKRQLEEVEKRLVKARAERAAILQEIERLKAQKCNMEFPKEGNISNMGVVFSSRQSLQYRIEMKQNAQERVERQIVEFQEEYRSANLEYEKMKYLDELEVEKLLEALKTKEAKTMDEIALQLAIRKKREPQS